MSITFEKVTAHIGARVHGVDPTQPLDRGTAELLRAAVAEHKALVFDAPGLTHEGQEAFANALGEVTTAHPTVPGDPTANVLAVDSRNGKANAWHTDVTFVVNPPAITTLRAITLPEYGGETLVANTGAAYAALPEPLKVLAENLWATHSNIHDYADPVRNGRQEYRDVFESTEFETIHPVVRVHPETGERGLFIGNFVRRLEGLSGTEGKAIQQLLQAYVTRPEHVLRWRWSPGELLIFDNRITQHYAADNYDDQARQLTRVTVSGSVPVAVNGEQSRSVVGDSGAYNREEVAA